MTTLSGYTKYNIPNTSRSAYTLIEVLVGLTIIGFLFAIGFASYRDFARREALISTAKKVQGDLRLAQGFALAGEKPEDPFCTGSNLLNYYGFKVYNSNEYKIEANCTGGTVVNKDVTIQSGIQLSIPSPNPIKFKVLGQGTNIPDGQSVNLIFTQTGTTRTYTITISSGGDIK